MANNIAVSVTADVADLVAKRAILSSELKAATADLNAFAKTARTGGMTSELRADMLGSASAISKTRAEIKNLDGAMKELSGGKNFFDNVFDRSRLAVLEEGTARMPVFGSAIEALGPAGIAAAAGLAAVFGAVEQTIKADEWAESLKRASSTLGLTTSQLQEFDFVFKSLGINVDEGRKALSGLEISIGRVMEGAARKQQLQQFTEVLKISPDQLRSWGTLENQIPHIVDAFAKLDPEERAATAQKLGVDPEVIASLVTEREEINKLIDEFHAYGLNISSDVIDKGADAAVQMHATSAIIDGEMRKAFIELSPLIVAGAKSLADWAKDVADVVKGVTDLFKPVSDAWKALQDFNTELDKAIPFLGDLDKAAANAPNGIDDAKNAVDDLKTKLDESLFPLAAFIDLLKQLGAADRNLNLGSGIGSAGANSGMFNTPKPKQEIANAGKKGKGPDVVAEWEEQLHAQEVASGEFFKDQTAMELKFWQDRLDHTKEGSKDWLAVQSKIYEAQKTLAHQAYDEQIASLNEQLEVHRSNWSQEQALWKEKLDYIKEHYGERSKEYLEAQRQEEAAERTHQQAMLQIQRDAEKNAIDELKDSLKTRETIISENAKTAESAINAKAKYSGNPLAGIQAAQQVNQIEMQLLRQKMALQEQAYQAENTQREQAISQALAADGKDSAAYLKAVQDKERADAQWANQKAVLLNQMVNQEKAAAQKVRDAWHQTVDPLVATTGNQIKGLIEGTETWGQALKNIGEEALSLVIDAIEHMVEEWIVSMLMGQASQKTTALSQVMSYAGVAGAAGTASMAGAPFPLDMTAVAFGEAMSGAAMSFAGLASFDVGTNSVPRDMIAQVHAGERIMPEADNRALMTALNGGRGGAGDVHFNVTQHNHGSAADSAAAMRPSQVKKQLRNMARNGSFRSLQRA